MKRTAAVLLALVCLLSACTAGPSNDYTPPDYSAHGETYGDEGSYLTELADLTLLDKGEPALTVQIEADSEWRGRWSGEWSAVWGYDARSCDVSGEDLSGIRDRNDITFNSDTRWPTADKLPEGFDPETVLELGKDPGLGIRALHDQGITGAGVGIAIIDQGLYTGHEEYRDRLMLYESIHNLDGHQAAMHGAAVASIAVGKDVGVAPGAKLYYIASTFGHYGDGKDVFDASIMADGIRRVLEIDRHLPAGEKIRVISISRGVMPGDLGYQELVEAIRTAGEAGILVLTTSTRQFYEGFHLVGMSRDGMADPNDPQSYGPAAWLADAPPYDEMEDAINVPMGSRSYAGWTGEGDHEWNYTGGMSWAVPWMAGFYALCCQVSPELTVEAFVQAVRDTATVRLLHRVQGQEYSYGRIIDPAAVIERLKNQ